MREKGKKALAAVIAFLVVLCLAEMPDSARLRVQAAAKNGFVTENGNTYYYRNGKKVKGLQLIKKKYYYFDTKTKIMLKNAAKKIDGKNYFFHANKGYAITGVKKMTVSKKECYVFFDPSTKKGYAAKGLATDPTTKKIYYVSSANDGKVLTGAAKTVNKKAYYFDSKYGYAVSGLVKQKKEDGTYSGKYYDLKAKNGYAAKGFVTDAKGNKYIIGDKGVVKTGLQRVSAKEVYLVDKTTLKMLTGWQVYNGAKYYFDTKTKQALSGLQTIEGKRYIFTEKNTLKTDGSIMIGTKEYYCNENGEVVEGIVKRTKSNNTVYYKYYDTKEASGYAPKGLLKEENGDMYLIGNAGVLLTGLQRVSETELYYADKTTLKVQTGWQEYNGYRYYFDESDAKAASGLTTIDEKRYIFGGKNTLIVNNQTKIGEKVYYCNENGEVTDGIVQRVNAEGKTYYRYYDSGTETGYPDLEGANKGVVDGKYCVDSSGVLHTGVQNINGKYYYFDETTLEMQTGVFPMGNKGYSFYFDPKENLGIVDSVGIAEKGGKLYYFSSSSNPYSIVYEGLRYVSEDDAKAAGLDGVYYFDRETGAALCNTSKTVGPITFVFGEDGKAVEWIPEKEQYPGTAEMFAFGLNCIGKKYGEIKPGTKKEAEEQLLKMETYTCSTFVAACYKAGFDSFEMYEGYSRMDYETKKYGMYADEQAYKCARDGRIFYNPEDLQIGDFVFFNDESCDNMKETGTCNRITDKIGGKRTHVHHIALYMGTDGESHYLLEMIETGSTVRIKSLVPERLVCADHAQQETGSGEPYYIVAYGRLGSK